MKHLSRRGRGGFNVPPCKRNLPPKKPKPDQPKPEQNNTPPQEEAESKQEAKPEEQPMPADDKPKGPSKRQMRRLKLRERLLKEGRIVQTEYTVARLMRRKPPVVDAVKDVQDEAEMRCAFLYQGTAGAGEKYFTQAKYKFKYFLAKDGTPVCQIHDTLSMILM
mmetsp:Transcript_75786/g.149822  ORF Transcript_75786/g.149822 Transcript_75786/m.149822 type:complete len:164 (-) Transcript_75786:23-514(-)